MLVVFTHDTLAAVKRALSRVTREVLLAAPVSLREIARAAKVPHSTLARIVRGERNATPSVARALERLFRQWSRQYARAAHRLKAALRK